jgi:hypothetical protein
MERDLPAPLLIGAILRERERAWKIADFPHALETAPGLGYACLGGQFQYRFENSTTHELYWLAADSSERRVSESWSEYCLRSCTEVRTEFERLVRDTDFQSYVDSLSARFQATAWPEQPVFCGYFVCLAEFEELSTRRKIL